MKNSIKTTGGMYSTARMLVDYTEKLYMPLMELSHRYYGDIESVIRFNSWKENIENCFNEIKISQISNLNNVTIDAGDNIDVACKVELPNISPENISVQVYSGKIQDNGTLGEINVVEMEEDKKEPGVYRAKLKLTTGGDYGYKNKKILVIY